MGSFGSEGLSLPIDVPEFLSFCLGCEKLLPDVESDLELSDLCSDLFPEVPEVPEVGVSRETSPHHSQY